MEEHRLDDTSSVNSEDWGQEDRKRDTWPGRCDFILSCVGYSVGLGNFWRFPYLCYKNGGGAFLVPYVICLMACGLPLTILEMNLGQFVSLGPTALFAKFCPLFQGLGWTQMIITCMCNIYYNMIIGWTIYYLYLSISARLPWASCGNPWNTEFCVAAMADLNKTGSANATKTASEEFWKRYVLDISPGIEDLGGMNWPLFVCFAIAWVIIFCCLFKGVKSSGRIVYVTATFPYVGMVILFIRAITFPGAFKGLEFYFIPKWEKLADVNVWIAAASQIFYSVGFVWGGLITFASFNKFNHNSYRISGKPACRVNRCGPYGCACSCIFIDLHKGGGEDEREMPHHKDCSPPPSTTGPTKRCTLCLDENVTSYTKFVEYIEKQAHSRRRNWPDPAEIRVCDCNVHQWERDLTKRFPKLEFRFWRRDYVCPHCQEKETEFITVHASGWKTKHKFVAYEIRLAKAACRVCCGYLFYQNNSNYDPDDDLFDLSLEL